MTAANDRSYRPPDDLDVPPDEPSSLTQSDNTVAPASRPQCAEPCAAMRFGYWCECEVLK